jgi:uncharacterized cupin superfamily protein
MDPINIAAPRFERDPEDPEIYRGGMFRFGKAMGLGKLGISVYELDPGQKLCPYHYEYGEEEALIVLEGTPTVRLPDGERVLQPWDCLGFVEGPDGAHQVRNDSDGTVRFLMFSTVTYPAGTVYPDSDKVALWTGNREDDTIMRRSLGLAYYDGEA